MNLRPRIVGGEPAEIEHFKWQAALFDRFKYICGATIITETKLVTAGHCTFAVPDVRRLQARVGSKYPDEGGQLVSIKFMQEHKEFNKPTGLNNDIAVLLLKEPLQFSATIGPIPLATNSLSLSPGTFVTLSGFGSTTLSGSRADRLYYLSLPIVDQKQCIDAFKGHEMNAKITENMICAGFLGTGGKDACKGDSGGAIS